MAPFPGGRASPGHFVPAGGGGAIEILVDNSSAQGIVAFGGWAWPVDPAAVRGHFRIGVRDAAGDRIEFDQNWSGEPPLSPPFYVMNVINQVGDPADSGNNAWRAAFNTACQSIANGARWETAAGVARVVTLAFTIIYGNSVGLDTCPRTSIFASIDYAISATFTG